MGASCCQQEAQRNSSDNVAEVMYTEKTSTQAENNLEVEQQKYSEQYPPEPNFEDPPKVEEPPEPKVEGPPSAFYTVMLDKSTGRALGVDIDKTDPLVCVITFINPEGLVAQWNQRNAGQAVAVHDRILKVNGEALPATEDLKTMLKVERGSLELSMERPMVKEITVKKNGRKLGLAVSVNEHSLGVWVKKIEEGQVIADMNGQDDGKTLNTHDRIVEIDGVTKPPSAFIEKLKLEEFTMKVHSFNI